MASLIPTDTMVAFWLSMPMYKHWTFKQMKSYLIAENVKAAIGGIRVMPGDTPLQREEQMHRVCDVLEAIAQAVQY
jgi:hypothetical protein